MIKFFGYAKCSTCQKAKKFLSQKGVKVEDIDIATTPPSRALLEAALASDQVSISDLFNKSGQLYRELNMKEKLRQLTTKQLLELLTVNGKLIKRPFITDGKKVTVGFCEEDLMATWG